MAHLMAVFGGLILLALAIFTVFQTLDRGDPRAGTLANISASELSTPEYDPATERFALEGEDPIDRIVRERREANEAAALRELERIREEEAARRKRMAERREELLGQLPDSQGYLTVQVEHGDTLRRLAERHFGDPDLWDEIVRANRSRVRRDLDLRPGMRLKIPSWLVPEDR